MSISPTQMSLEIAFGQSSVAAQPATSPSSSPKVAVTDTAGSPPAAPVPPPPSVTTDVKIDDQHQFYYQFVDGSTGNVVFEIPPEALRAMSESLNLPFNGEAGPHALDVKS